MSEEEREEAEIEAANAQESVIITLEQLEQCILSYSQVVNMLATNDIQQLKDAREGLLDTILLLNNMLIKYGLNSTIFDSSKSRSLYPIGLLILAPRLFNESMYYDIAIVIESYLKRPIREMVIDNNGNDNETIQATWLRPHTMVLFKYS
jgi:hypothetical protein